MLARPHDLLVRSPESFASDDGRRTATVFRDALGCLTPLVLTERMEEARHWLAELVFERRKYHNRVEPLRIDVLVIALRELRSRKWISH